jgi:hypothetical protein
VSDHPDECDCAECLRAEAAELRQAYRDRLGPAVTPALDPRKVLLAQMAASIAAGFPEAYLLSNPEYRPTVALQAVAIARAILDEVGLGE